MSLLEPQASLYDVEVAVSSTEPKRQEVLTVTTHFTFYIPMRDPLFYWYFKANGDRMVTIGENDKLIHETGKYRIECSEQNINGNLPSTTYTLTVTSKIHYKRFSILNQ